MNLFKKKNKEEKTYTTYTGKATFYHNNGTSTVVKEGSFSSDEIQWLKENIGTAATWINDTYSVNLKYFYSIQFDFNNKVEGC